MRIHQEFDESNVLDDDSDCEPHSLIKVQQRVDKSSHLLNTELLSALSDCDEEVDANHTDEHHYQTKERNPYVSSSMNFDKLKLTLAPSPEKIGIEDIRNQMKYK